MISSFTVDITGTTGMRTGEWADGEEFLILPDDRQQHGDAAARIRLLAPDASPADGDGPPGSTTSGGPGEDSARRQVTVAEVEERQRQRRGVPHPVLVVQSMDDKVLATLLPEEPGVSRPASFRLEDDQGGLLCRITRRDPRIGHRAYWRIHPADGSPVLTGYRGTWPGWLGYVLSYPLWLLFFVGSLIVTLVTLGEVTNLMVWGGPKRVCWRREGTLPVAGTALDFRYMRTGYRWNPELLDSRIAYAQAALHYFTKMHQD